MAGERGSSQTASPPRNRARGQTVIVTGAAGFIGSHVCEALLRRGDRVIGIDNFDPYYDSRMKRRNLDEVRRAAAAEAGDPAFEFIEADICDEPAMRSVFSSQKQGSVEGGRDRSAGPGVIHLAAKAGVRPSIADPVAYARVNVQGTSVLLAEAERAGCSRFVLASSSSVYGNNAKVPFAEADDVSEPISPYAATKRACELLGHTHFALTKMPVACLRFFTVYGPRQRPDLAIGMFLTKVGAGEEIPVFGSGATSRDYTYIDDIVSGVLASYDRVAEFGFRIWNLGGNRPTPLSDMIGTIGRVTGSHPRIKRLPAQPGDVERTCADLSRSAAELNYFPRTNFEDGVRKQWEWIRQAGA